MIRLKAITPRAQAIKFTRFAKAAELGLEDAAKEALKDFEATTATWEHKPAFTMKKFGDGYEIGTRDEIYGYVDLGTRPHIIRPRRAKRLRFSPGSRAKTSPGRIGSSSGKGGSGAVFAKQVNHPGNKPRGFSKLIKRKWESRLQQYIQKRIREAA